MLEFWIPNSVNGIDSEETVHRTIREKTRINYDGAFKVFGHSILIQDDVNTRRLNNDNWQTLGNSLYTCNQWQPGKMETPVYVNIC